MSEAIHKVRVKNIARAKNAWKLKQDGLANKDIAKQLSVTANTINNIFHYTQDDYYPTSLKEKQSYYDTKIMIIQQISNEKKKLKEITGYIEKKRQIFLRIFEITAVLIVLLIII